VSTTKLTINGSWQQFIEPLKNLQPFTTYGALRGNYYPNGAPTTYGRLPDGSWRFAERAAFIIYVVWSYETPIAWFDCGRGWAYPPERYSVTTSKHQGRIFAALSVLIKE
jgi:hypothetical protein